MRAGVTMCVMALVAVGCQLTGGPAGAPSEVATGGSEQRLGAPDEGMPQQLDELLRRGARIAEEWQDAPVLAEVEVDVNADGAWTGARLIYLAGEADRFLSLVTAGAAFTQERPTLSTLQLQPITADGVAQLPAFPEDALQPRALVKAEDAAACDVRLPATVLYVTGAPVAWDGTSWSSPPQWRATVTTDGGGSAVLDVQSGEGECLPA